MGATPTTALAGAVGILGILAAWWLFLRRPATAEKLAATPIGSALHRLWFAGWGFDWLYDRLLVRPLVWLARVNRADFIDWFYRGVGKVSLRLHRGLSLTVNGQVRWYAAGLAIGAIVILALVVLL